MELDDVRAATGDASATNVGDAVDAALVGDVARFDEAFTRLSNAGGQVSQLLSAAMRQLQQLQQMRYGMDSSGRNAAAAVAAARPPVFFARKKLVEDALRRWSLPALARALERVQGAVLQSRREPDLGGAVARQALLALAVEAARAARGA